MNLMRWGTEADQISSFAFKTVIHIMNEASVRDLRKRVSKKYSENPQIRDQIIVDTVAFRPNLVIDTNLPY